MTTEHDKARLWREAKELTLEQLSQLTGYSVSAIYWFERGVTPPSRKAPGDRAIADWVWQRYRAACAGVDAELAGRKFKW